MLKIDQVELAKLGFNPHELKHLNGDAKVVYGKADASSEAPSFKGVFRMVNCGAATMCKIDAAGQSVETSGSGASAKTEPAAIVLNKPEDLSVELRAKVSRKVFIEAGSKRFDSHIEDKTGVSVLFDGNPCGADTKIDPDTKTFWYTLPEAAEAICRDRVATVVLVDADHPTEGVVVATAAAHDSNVNHKIAIMPDNDEGLLHFAILANADVMAGKKPNKATFEVRGSKPWKVLGEKACVALKSPVEASEDEEAEENP